jgi:hypothetical protein
MVLAPKFQLLRLRATIRAKRIPNVGASSGEQGNIRVIIPLSLLLGRKGNRGWRRAPRREFGCTVGLSIID